MKIIANRNDIINIAIDRSNEIEIDLHCKGEKTSTHYVRVNMAGELFVFGQNFPNHLESESKSKENDK